MKLRDVARILPTERTAIVVASAAPVWLLAFTPWGKVVAIIVTIAVAGAILSDVVRLPSPAALIVSRDLPHTAGLGDEITGRYRLESAWNAHLAGLLFDSIPRELRAVQPGARPFSLSANGRATIDFSFAPATRGSWELGAIAARVFGPLELVQRTISFLSTDSITVAPSLTPVREYQLLAMKHSLREIGVRTIRRRGEGRSFSNLRDYTPGDDPRFIDWKHSARRNKLISREFTEERGQSIMIVIDAGRMMTQLAGDAPRFEHALSSALVLASVAANGQDRVGLMVFDETVRAYIPPTSGKRSLAAIRDALISIQPVLTEPDYAAAFATLAIRQRSRALVVVFTDVIDARASRAMIANITRKESRHLHLVVALRSDPLFAAAEPRPEKGIDALYESAAAEELVLARGEALQRMRMAHVSVVDVSPSQMTAAVVNRYLEIKSRGDL
jgi:uncharacterized protein (DUF58 family)